MAASDLFCAAAAGEAGEIEDNRNAEQNVFNLAGEFISLTDARRVPNLIAKANLKYLKIGVGSEISCMVNPEVCWVANTRTIWTHLVIMHNDSIQKADEHLKLYREADGTSEMEYQAWEAIHAELRVALEELGAVVGAVYTEDVLDRIFSKFCVGK